MNPIDAFIYRQWIQSLYRGTQLLQPDELAVESCFDAPRPPDELLSLFTNADGGNTQRHDVSNVSPIWHYFTSFRSQA